jgi:hypothetical protein
MNCLALLYVLELMGWFMVFNTNFNNTTVKLWLSDMPDDYEILVMFIFGAFGQICQ